MLSFTDDTVLITESEAELWKWYREIIKIGIWMKYQFIKTKFIEMEV